MSAMGLSGCDLLRTDDAGVRGFADFVRGELRREVERHQVLDGGIDRLKLCPVEQCLLCVGDGRLEVGLSGIANAMSRWPGEEEYYGEKGHAIT